MRLHLPDGARRACRLTAVIVLFAVLAGATYQGVATALERRTFPHPGRLVDVGGHQLHIHCTGEGSPTVVLEAAAASMSASWGLIQPRIAATTRVCSYDRAGLGWSEAGDERFTPSRAVDELPALLDVAGERGPFIIVGRGLGAAYAKTFAGRHPARTAALVLVEEPDEARGLSEQSLIRINAATPWLARVGIRRALRRANAPAAGLPEANAGATRTFLNRPDHLTRAVAELAMWRETVQMAAAATPAAPTLRSEPDPDHIVATIEAAIAHRR